MKAAWKNNVIRVRCHALATHVTARNDEVPPADRCGVTRSDLISPCVAMACQNPNTSFAFTLAKVFHVMRKPQATDWPG